MKQPDIKEQRDAERKRLRIRFIKIEEAEDDATPGKGSAKHSALITRLKGR